MLIEADLLIPLFKKNDWLKELSEQILYDIENGMKRGVYCSSATIQEIVFWLYNRELYRESVEAVNALISLKNVEWVPVTPKICLNAAVLVEEYGLSPFDAYHAATALGRDSIILSTDHAYDKVTGISRIDPEDYVNRV